MSLATHEPLPFDRLSIADARDASIAIPSVIDALETLSCDLVKHLGWSSKCVRRTDEIADVLRHLIEGST